MNLKKDFNVLWKQRSLNYKIKLVILLFFIFLISNFMSGYGIIVWGLMGLFFFIFTDFIWKKLLKEDSYKGIKKEK